MEEPLKGRLLLVGEGDFSFTVALMSRYGYPGNQVVATSIETEDTIQKHQLAATNRQILADQGVQVCFEVDATYLQLSGALQVTDETKFSRIVFNFPHAGGKSNHKKNRALLNNFFASAIKVLSPEGQIMVTLCKGQGGTPADQPMRAWHDSWQIVSMAANSSLILRQVAPFNIEDYPEYNSVGFRSQDKGFNTDGALTHVFELSDLLQVTFDLSTGPSDLLGTSSVCPRYLVDKLNRKLLYCPCHPLRQLRLRIEASLSETMATQAHHLDNASLVKRGLGPLAADANSDDTTWLKELFPSPYVLEESKHTGVFSRKEKENFEVKEKDESETSPNDDESLNINNTGMSFSESACEAASADVASGLHLRSSAVEELPPLAYIMAGSGVGCHVVSCDVYGQRLIRETAPVGHQMMLIHKETNPDESMWAVCRVLQKATNFYFEMSPMDDVPVIASDFGDLYATHKILIMSDDEDSGKLCGGVFKWTSPDELGILAILLDLNVIAQQVLYIPHASLFWSTDSHFRNQFTDDDNKPLVRFLPFSLHSMKYLHDLSFWDNPDKEFDEQQFHNIIRDVCGDTVTGVRLIDSHCDEETTRRSRCYGITFQSHDLALSYITSWKLQSVLRLQVANQLGICLR